FSPSRFWASVGPFVVLRLSGVFMEESQPKSTHIANRVVNSKGIRIIRHLLLVRLQCPIEVPLINDRRTKTNLQVLNLWQAELESALVQDTDASNYRSMRRHG